MRILKFPRKPQFNRFFTIYQNCFFVKKNAAHQCLPGYIEIFSLSNATVLTNFKQTRFSIDYKHPYMMLQNLSSIVVIVINIAR